MIEEIWNHLIEFTAKFVVPDWGALVALIPSACCCWCVLYLVWVGRAGSRPPGPPAAASAGSPPVAPAGIHMPGAVVRARCSARSASFFLVFGLVAGGLWLLVGGVILAITLLYWGREAMRDYDHTPAGRRRRRRHRRRAAAPRRHAARRASTCPAPSFRPLLVAHRDDAAGRRPGRRRLGADPRV